MEDNVNSLLDSRQNMVSPSSTGDNASSLYESRQDIMASPLTFITDNVRNKALQKVNMAEDYANQQIQQDLFTSNLFSTPDSNKIQLTGEANFSDVYAKVGDKFVPRFENFQLGTDNNERLAQQQSTWDKLMNGLPKAGVNALTTVAGSTIGVFTGASNAISQGSWDGLYTDGFNSWLDELNEELRYKLPNYYTKQEQDLNFFQSLGTANFWANDLPGGISFTLGAIVGEGIWAAATGGASLATTAARWGLRGMKYTKILKGVNKYKNLNKKFLKTSYADDLAKAKKKATNYSKTADILNTLRFTATSAGYEAGVEARHFLKEAEENFIHYYETNYGRKPTAQEMSDFKKDNTSAGNALFAANLALVGGSNLAIFGRMFDIKSPLSSPLKGFSKFKNKNLYGTGTKRAADGTLEKINPSLAQKIVGRTRDFAKAPLIEGFWEEGNQSVAGNMANDWVSSGYDLRNTRDNYDMIGALYNSYAQTYGSKEGWKEIGIGMMVGFLGGAAGGNLNRYGREQKQQEAIVELSKQSKELAEILKQSSYGADVTADRMKAMNQIVKATEDQTKANERGDKTAEELARARAILANISVNKKYDRIEDAIEDLRVSLDLVDSESWANDLGVDVSEIEDYKAKVLQEYKTLSEEYSDNKDFADLILGKYATTKDLKNKETVAQAVAYNLTMGKESLKNAELFLDEVTIELAKVVSPEKEAEIKTALGARKILEISSEQARQELLHIKEKRERLKEEKEALEKKITDLNKDLPGLEQEGKIKRQQELTQLAQELEELNLLEQTLQNEFQVSFDKIKQQFPFQTESDYISADELDNILKLNEEGKISGGILAQVDDIINAQKEVNPVRAERLEKMFNEYQKSIYAFKEFSKTFAGISNPNFSPANFVTKLEQSIAGITKKEANEFTKEFFAQVGQQAANDAQTLMNESKKTQTQTEKPEEEEQEEGDYTKVKKAVDKIINSEKIVREDFELMNKYPKLTKRLKELEFLRQKEKKNVLRNTKDFLDLTPAQEKSFINKRHKQIDKKYDDKIKQTLTTKVNEGETEVERLERLIKQTTEDNNLVSRYIGENKSEANKNKPTQKQIDKFVKLRDKKDLTEQEQEDLDRLNTQLSNWQIVEGTMVLGVNATLADVIERLQQLKTTISKEKVKEENTRKDYINIQEVSEKNSSATRNDVRALQSLNGVYINIDGNKVALSHVDVTSILNKYLKENISKIEMTIPKGKKKVEASMKQVRKNQKREGTTFFITLEGQENPIEFTVGESGRLNFSTEIWNSVKDLLSLKFYTEPEIDPQAKNKSYVMGYEVLEDGSVIPAKSDFVVENDLEQATPQELENAERLTTYVDPKSSYNKMLLNKYNRAVKSGQQDKIDKALKELEENVAISLLTQDKFAGYLRAFKGNNSEGETAMMFLEIRKLAAKKLLESKGENLINLETVIPVNFKYKGSPVFNLQEVNGQLEVVPQKIGARELSKIEDAGFVQNGELKIGKKKVEDVDKTYLPKNTDKTPVIVFDYNGSLVAFPVNLTTGTVDKSEALGNIFADNSVTLGTMINKINDLLIANGIEPRVFNLSENNITTTETQQQLVEALSNVKTTPNIDNWVNKDFNLNDLSFEATLPIDITNRPFNTPKSIMDIKSATIGASFEMRNEVEDNQAIILERIIEYVESINLNYGKYPGEGAFIEALGNSEQLPSRLDLEPLKGVDRGFNKKVGIMEILDRLVNNYTITKGIKSLHPEGFFENVRKDIERFKALGSRRKKMTTALKSQIKEILNQEC